MGGGMGTLPGEGRGSVGKSRPWGATPKPRHLLWRGWRGHSLAPSAQLPTHRPSFCSPPPCPTSVHLYVPMCPHCYQLHAVALPWPLFQKHKGLLSPRGVTPLCGAQPGDAVLLLARKVLAQGGLGTFLKAPGDRFGQPQHLGEAGERHRASTLQGPPTLLLPLTWAVWGTG